jgi:hypothetical protein
VARRCGVVPANHISTRRAGMDMDMEAFVMAPLCLAPAPVRRTPIR